MLMFWFDVNFKRVEKLVPITRRFSTSIEPVGVENELKRVERVPENGPLREREAKAYFVMWKLLMRER